MQNQTKYLFILISQINRYPSEGAAQSRTLTASLLNKTWQNLSPYAVRLLSCVEVNGRGYTAHEMLPTFALINMNGRLYDPVLGRMLSPDNYIQLPDYTQNFNRYSYVLNNPLKYTDPDGEWVQLVIGAILGGYSGYQIGNAMGATGWSMAGYIVGGAVIGAVSGGIASEIAASGGFMANTMSIVAGTYINSTGMAMLSGGQTDVTVGFGAGSYNLTQNELNGIWNFSDNTVMENIGYGVGAFANVSDIYAIGNNINLTMSTKYKGVGHNSLYGGDPIAYDIETHEPSLYEVDISVGPGEFENVNMAQKSSNFKKVPTNPYWDKYSKANDPSFKLPINNVNKSVLERMSNNLKGTHSITEYIRADGVHSSQTWYNNLSGRNSAFFRFPGNVCTSYVSRALWRVGVPNIGIFPHMLYSSLLLRQTVIYNNSFFIGY